jgi:lipopolysaccharide/colanic/teichoic acid biosynthesis glycosyltransferase
MVHREVTEFAPLGMGDYRSAPTEVGAAPVGNHLIRLCDVIIAVMALVFLAPLMLLIAGAIYLQDGGKPIFKHQRIGFNGRRFYCLKFRSMVVDADVRLQRLLASDDAARQEWARDQKLRNDPRITWLGRFLRSSSCDELPQLINVIRGEMSIVGPRPIVEAEIVRYGRRFRSYCSVRPGITGLWQVSGRNDTSYRRRVALDHAYSRMNSLGLYLFIIVATIPAVLMKKGSY